MLEPLHIKLLKELAKHGVGRPIDIQEFVSTNFIFEKSSAEKETKDIYSIYLFLRDLQYKGIINNIDQEAGLIRWVPVYNGNKMTVKNGLEDSNSNFYLTIQGLDYLDNYEQNKLSLELNKSYRDVNQASLTNYSIQKLGLGLTVLFSLSALVVSIATYIKPEPKMAELNKNILSISQRLDSIKTSLNKLKSQPASNSDLPHRP